MLFTTPFIQLRKKAMQISAGLLSHYVIFSSCLIIRSHPYLPVFFLIRFHLSFSVFYRFPVPLHFSFVYRCISITFLRYYSTVSHYRQCRHKHKVSEPNNSGRRTCNLVDISFYLSYELLSCLKCYYYQSQQCYNIYYQCYIKY